MVFRPLPGSKLQYGDTIRVYQFYQLPSPHGDKLQWQSMVLSLMQSRNRPLTGINCNSNTR